MSNPQTNQKVLTRSAGIATLAVSFFVSLASAQSTDAPPTTRPLLDQLNHETQTLFKDVAPSIVRVQLPLPSNISLLENDPLSKWANQLDPDSLARLAEVQRRFPGASFAAAEIRPATMPATPEAATTQQSRHVIVLRLDRFSPNGIGIVLDDQNHLLIPRYVDKAACPFPIPVSLGDGRWATATFVASDAPADLTLLKLSPYVKAKPATLASQRPDAGTLILVMSLNPAANRLTVWEGWEPDNSALINIDGSIAGFTKAGRFISAGAFAPLAQDLLQHGVIHRPLLGVIIQTITPDDPQRQLNPTLGSATALKILQVFPNTPADHAGLQVNDLLTSVAGQPIGDESNFAAIIAERRGPTPLGLLRDGQTHVVNVDLEVH